MSANQPAQETDAFPNWRFYVEVDGMKQAVFTALNGLQAQMDVSEYEEGGNNGFVHKLPGRTKIGNVTLKRGITRSNDFLKWYMQIAQGKIERRNVSVVMYDVKGEVVQRWNFVQAYPVKWTGPEFSADGTAAAVESLELAHDGMSLG